jgi:hypothetical protein
MAGKSAWRLIDSGGGNEISEEAGGDRGVPSCDDDVAPFHEWAEMVGFENFASADGAMSIDTLEGVMTAQPGDWIIKGVKGEFYPCKPDIFVLTYEPAEAP